MMSLRSAPKTAPVEVLGVGAICILCLCFVVPTLQIASQMATLHALATAVTTYAAKVRRNGMPAFVLWLLVVITIIINYFS